MTCKIQCAWCKKDLGTKDGFGEDMEGKTTHSCCESCSDKMIDDCEDQLEQDKVKRIKNYLLTVGIG